MENESDEKPYTTKFWETVMIAKQLSESAQKKVEELEDAYIRHTEEHASITKAIKEVNDRLSSNGEKLAGLLVMMETQKKEIDLLWVFPLKVAGAIIALGGASTVAYKIAKWFVRAGDISRFPQ